MNIKNIKVKNIAIIANANKLLNNLSQYVVSKFSQIILDGSAASWTMTSLSKILNSTLPVFASPDLVYLKR